MVNYDETKVGTHPLPPLLTTSSGKDVKTADEWKQQRRPEILALYEQHEFGRTPTDWGKVEFKVKEVKADALGGKAIRKLIHVSLPQYPKWQGMEVMLYLPKSATSKPVPAFVGLSFGGNHAASTETDVPLSTRWMREGKDKGVVANRATEASRGTESSRWPLELIVEQGFGVATAYYGDLEPDHAEGWKDGLRAALSPDGANTVWKDGDWGAIGAWAWGVSRILDYLETDAEVDAKHVGVIGHSRLGKTSLWAGAQDERFALVVSNNSGEGGAALMRRDFGETTAIITKAFPHWFTPTYAKYAGAAEKCPVDQHMLIALAAPRPMYIASATEDQWADPKGEFLSGWHARPAYQLFGLTGYDDAKEEVLPLADHPIGLNSAMAYHLRTGKHDVTSYDWAQYLKFARHHFEKKQP